MSVKDVYKLENHSLVSRCNFYIILFNNQNRDNNDSGTGVSVVEYATESKNYNQDFMVNQLKIMSNIRHENIATFLHTFMLNSKLYVIYPEFLFGSVHTIVILKNSKLIKKDVPFNIILNIIYQVSRALIYLEYCNIVHRCICSRNIMISSTGRVCLTNFKRAISMCDSHGVKQEKIYNFPNMYGSYINWASPEIIQQSVNGYNASSDVYSFGTTIIEIVNGQIPFNGYTNLEIMLIKLRGIVEPLHYLNVYFEMKNKKVLKIKDRLEQLVLNMCCLDPETRMTPTECSEHVIMKSVIKKKNQCSDLRKNILMNDRLIANLSWDSILHQEMDIIDETNRNVNDLCNYKYPFIRHCKENMKLFTQTEEPIKTARRNSYIRRLFSLKTF